MFANLIFFLIIEVGLSKIVSNVIDLHHNKKIEGGGQPAGSQSVNQT